MENHPGMSEEETVPLGSVPSQSEELYPATEAKDSKSDLTKTLTSVEDIVAAEPNTVPLGITVNSLTEEENENWAEGLEEEDEVHREEDGEQREEKEDEADDKDAGEVDEAENQEDREKQEEDFEMEEEEDEEEESEEELEEQGPEEEKILMDYEFPGPKEIKVKSDSDLSKIPSEVFGERNAMLQMLKDLVAERPNLTLRNRYLEYKSFKHLQTLQVAGSPPIDDGSNFEEEMEKNRYMNFLGNYKKESEGIRARENQLNVSLDYAREKLAERLSDDGEIFGELKSRETAVAVDLVFATNGRRLTQKRVEEMIRRQTARRRQMSHERYTFIRLWYMFEEIDARIRRLDTLGPGKKLSDYEADFSANLVAKTKFDEKNKELQKARARVCGIMAAITHGKVKLSYLRDEIDYQKNCHSQILESVQRQREALSSTRSQLSSMRNWFVKKRETAGLMLALPTLREMERVQALRELLKDKIDYQRSLIRKPRRTGNKRVQQLEKKMQITQKNVIPERC